MHNDIGTGAGQPLCVAAGKGEMGITLAVAVVINAGMWLIISVMPAMQAELGVDRADASLPYTLTMIGFAVGNYAAGKAVDRFGVTVSIIGAAFLVALGFMVAIYSTSIAMISFAQLLVGLGSAVGFGPLIADISHWFMRRRGIAMAIVASGNYLSGAFWPLVLTGVLQDHGWRSVYMVMAVVTLGAVLPLAFGLRRRVSDGAHAAAEAVSAANAKSSGLSPTALACLLGVAGIGCCLAMSMPQVHIVAYCVDLGYGPAVGTQMLTMMLLGGVCSRLVSGRVGRSIGGRHNAVDWLDPSVRGVGVVFAVGRIGLALCGEYDFRTESGGIVPSYA